jgi:hypothetical protein
VVERLLTPEVGLAHFSPLFDPVEIEAEDHREGSIFNSGLASGQFSQFFPSLSASNQNDGEGLDIAPGGGIIRHIEEFFNHCIRDLLILECPYRPSFHHQLIEVHNSSFLLKSTMTAALPMNNGN